MRKIYTLLLLVGFSINQIEAQSRAVNFSFSYNSTADYTDYGSQLTDGEGGITDVPGVTYQIFFSNASETVDGNVKFYGYGNHSGESPSTYLDGRTGYLYPSGAEGSTPAYQLVMKTSDGSEFSFKNIYLVNFNSATASDVSLDIIGYRNGVTTGQITTHADNPQYGLYLTQSNGLTASIFENVDKVIIKPSNSSVYNTNFWYYVNDIGFDNAVTMTTLPVSWLSFDADLQSTGEVELKWKTANERENSHFVVEKSQDGRVFFEIGMVSGSNNSDLLSYYSYKDKSPVPGKNFYRLKQYDRSGNYSFSKIEIVNNRAEVGFSIYPNPAYNTLTIQYKMPVKNQVQLQLINTGGQIMLTKTWNLNSGNSISINTSYMAPGLYKLRLNSEQLNEVHDIIILK
jgi:hypothetical protein